MEDPRGDAELLSALRAGDRDAYVGLWKRHVGPAYRYAERLYPSRADDLVSDSFLAIYQLVTTTDKGPEFAFRSYLKTVMRNTAIKWSKEGRQVAENAEYDRIDSRDALSIIETESNASDLYSAFQALPERWQRVLWMAEVAEAGRPEIAKELGIKPNAVSALQRRARTGLKFQWLSQQIPPALREDSAHAARLIPRYLTDANDTEAAAELTSHIQTCESCDDLLRGMRGASARLQRTTLAALGFGALGTAVPAAASLTSGAAVTTVAMAAGTGIGITAGLVATGVSVLTVGGILITSWLTGIQPAESAHEPSALAPATVEEDPLDTVLPDLTDGDVTVEVPIEPAKIGRWVTDPTIPLLDLGTDPVSQYVPVAPQPAGPGVPGPGTGTGGTPTLGPGVTSPTVVSSYIAPMITGQTTPGNSVAIDFASQRYDVAVAPDGTWSFDPRPLTFDAGTYEYAVWAFTPTEQSPPTTGTITIQTLTVQGFEQVDGPMPLDEASTTGLVVSITGPASGTVWAMVNWASPVPGGMSTTSTSRSPQATSRNICCRADTTIGPRQIIGVSSSTRKPIDITLTP